MSVRAKVYCAIKAEQADRGEPESKMVSITLYPVMVNSEENKKFFKYTPNGKLELNILHPSASDQFIVGKEYYVDFTPVDELTTP